MYQPGIPKDKLIFGSMPLTINIDNKNIPDNNN